MEASHETSYKPQYSEYKCIDGHTCGNPVRLITSGHPKDIYGLNASERRLEFIRKYDWIRTGLMFEPRGHDMMSGSFLFPPSNPNNDLSILFLETSGSLPMCGHGTIGTLTFALEENLFKPKTNGTVRLETPAGLVEAYYQMNSKGKVESVGFKNVASFLYEEGIEVKHPYLGTLNVDISYGGNFYAIVDPQDNFKGLNVNILDLINWSFTLRKILKEVITPVHPTMPEIRGVSHVLWTGDPLDHRSDGRNAVFYGDRAIDRSPCGTGTSARMAQLFSKGRLKVGDYFTHESIIGSRFKGRVEKEIEIGNFSGIVPSIEGWAKITGYNKIIIDPEDPFAKGFQVV